MRWRANENPDIEVTDFQGLLGGYHTGDLPEGYARTATNVRFDNGRVEPRFPFLRIDYEAADAQGLDGSGALPSGGTLGIAAFQAGGQAHLLYARYEELRIRAFGLDALIHDSGNINATGGSSVWGAQLGSLLACGRYYPDATGDNATISPFLLDLDPNSTNYVYDPAATRGSEYVEPLFPVTKTDVTPVAATVSTGGIGPALTVGSGRVMGLVFQTKLGTFTKPIIKPAWTFTVSGPNIEANITITPATAWPTYYDKVYILLAPVATPNSHYILRDFFGTIPGGTTTPVVINGVDTPDASIALLDPSTVYEDLWRYLDTDTVDYFVTYAIPFRNRVLYVLNDADGRRDIALMSDSGAPTVVDFVDRKLALPQGATIMGAFVLNDMVWLSTSHGLMGWTHSSEFPVNWPDPVRPCDWQVTSAQGGNTVDDVRRLAFLGGAYGIRIFDGNSLLPERLTRAIANYQAALPLPTDYINPYKQLVCVPGDSTVFINERVNGLYAVHYEDIENIKVARYYPLSPSTGLASSFGGLAFGPAYMEGGATAFMLLLTLSPAGSEFNTESVVMRLFPRDVAEKLTGVGDDLIGTYQDFPFDYHIENLPGPVNGGDRDRASRLKYLVARLLTQNTKAFGKTVNLQLVRSEGSVNTTMDLVAHTPASLNARPIEITRNFSFPARTLGLRLHGNTVYGAWSLSRLRLWVQRWLR